MHLQEFGTKDGVPLVVLGGIPSHLEWADALVRRVQTSHRVLVPHLPGYGQTPASKPYSWRAVMNELETLLLERTRQPVIMVGHSAGAWRALELAARGALRVRGLLCLGATAQTPGAERDALRQFAGALRAGFDPTTIAAERLLAHRRDAEAVGAAQAMVSVAPEALADELEAFAAEPDVLPRLHGLRCPVILRTGSADASCPPAKAHAIAAAISTAHVEVIQGAGHLLWLETELNVFDVSEL